MRAPPLVAPHDVARALGLERPPFGAGCEDLHLATGALARREALIEQLVLGPPRIVVVADAAGSGKTTLLGRVAQRLSGRARVARLAVAASLGPEALLRRVTALLGIASGEQLARQLAAMREGLAERAAAGQLTVVVIDEAERLTAGALELLAALASRWPGDGLRFVLCGRPALVLALEAIAGDCDLPVRFVDLPRLDAGEVGDLVHLHLHGAGLRGDSPFDEARIAEVAQGSAGCPGRVGPLALEVLAAHANAGVTRGTRRRRVTLAFAAALLLVAAVPLGRSLAPSWSGERRAPAPDPVDHASAAFRSSVTR